jgi:hypothetical protein
VTDLACLSRRTLRALLTATLLVLSVAPQFAQTKPAPRAAKPAPPPASPIRFADITRAAGLDFQLTCGTPDKRYIMDSLCGGVAFFDYDNDGWMDLLLVNGSTLADLKAGKCHSSKLYHNNHDGTFSDVTAKSGLAHCGWGFGVAVGDYDNDGWEDVYITDLRGGKLYHNNGDGTFTDVTAKAGVGNNGQWGTSAAFGDYDNDGYLDLYIANYVDVDLDHLPEFGSTINCQYRGIPVSCGPSGMKGSRDRLYRNNGNGTFTDVTEKLNIDPDLGYGLGVLWLDYDQDGCPDLYVANDSTPSLLYHNDCHGQLHEIGAEAGVAFSSDGKLQAGMGVDAADYDHSGRPSIAKINFSDDTNNLYHNDGNGQFTDRAGPAGFGPISIPFLGFGVKFADFDNDGWPDILVANGHVNPQVDGYKFGVTYRERPLLFRNLGQGRFEEIGLRAGAPLSVPRVGRGLAVADFDNSGRLGALMSDLGGPPVLLRNVGPEHGHAIRIKTIGTRSNRDGFGARVEIRAGDLAQSAEVRASSSYLSASDPRLHFGLGPAARADRIVIRWPSGTVDTIRNESAGQELTVEEGKGVVARRTFAPSVVQPSHPARSIIKR